MIIDEYKINAGLKIGDSTIWVSTRTYQLKTTDYSAQAVQASPDTSNGPTKPFITSYPIITERDNDNVDFKGNEGFYIKYIIKTHPQTRGDYLFKVTPAAGVSVCKIVVTFIGDNMPCTEPPGPSLTGYENTEITYGVNGANAHEDAQPAQILMRVGLRIKAKMT